MEKENDFYTATMAKVYAGQGHWAKAADIYRHLLKQAPERDDYLEALAAVEKKIISSGNKPEDQLQPLFHEFFDLLLRFKNVEKLRRLI